MKAIYFLVATSGAFKDKLDVFSTYFIKDGGFLHFFWVALIIAAIFCVLYYVLCRCSFSFAKLSTWVATLVIAGIVSFGYTGYDTGISKAKGGALPKVVEQQFKKKTAGLTTDQQQTYVAEKNKIKKEFKKGMFGCNPVNRLCWTNFVLTMIFFYLFSIIINGLSGHGANIPHPGLIRR